MPARDAYRGGLTALALTLFVARTAIAAPTVLVLRTPDDRGPWRAAELRTADELRFMGLHVEVLRVQPGDVERTLDEHGAHAAIRIQRTADGARADVWIAAPPRRLHLDSLARSGHEAAAIAALRTAELAHAGISTPVPEAISPSPVPEAIPLVPVPEDIRPPTLPPEPPTAIPLPEPSAPPVVPQLAPPPPAAPSPFTPPPVVPQLADGDLPPDIPAPSAPPPRPRRARSLAVLAGVLGGPGGARPLVDLTLSLRISLTRLLALEPAITAAVTPVQATFDAGKIRLGLAGVGAALVLTPGRPDARVAPHLGLGGGVALAWATGQATSPLRSTTDLTAVATIQAAAGLAIRLRPRLRLRLDLGTAILLPPVAVRVAGDEVARLGTPLLRGALGLEWRL